MFVSIYTNKCNMQQLNCVFNKFKMNDSTHVKMLIVQKMWKNSLIKLFKYNYKHWVACVLIYYNKSKMKFVSNGFNILKVNGSTHVHMLIIEEMWKKTLIHFNINVRF
jgi:hypothetical protein